jgi:threonine/homoserine/homoserine lactone efflux protein
LRPGFIRMNFRENARMSGDLSALTAAALGIALSPVPFVLVVALLGSTRPVPNAVAFVSGEALAVACIVGAVVFVTADDGTVAPLEGKLNVLEVVVGVALGVLLVVHLRRPPRADGPPRWSTLLDRVGPRGAFAGGLAMVAINPKNLALTLAGSASIVQLGYSTSGQAASVLTFSGVAVSALLLLLALTAAFPARSASLLARSQSVVYSHERALVGILLGALAAFFLLRGLLATLT